MTIDRSLYIITKQIKQQAKHVDVSIHFVGEDPEDAGNSLNLKGQTATTSYLIHRVKLNDMGAKDVKIITYSELITDAQSHGDVVPEEDSQEACIRQENELAISSDI